MLRRGFLCAMRRRLGHIRRRRVGGVALALVAVASFAASPPRVEAAPDPTRLLLATTTSVQDSGLLDALLPEFEARTGVRVQVVAVGTGAALRMGADGNADVLIAHAPAAERELVASGAVLERRPFMENFFVLAGPPDDPAGVRSAEGPEEALRRIAAARAPFVSRADDSGTHKREVALFRAAGLDPEARWPGFARTGAGMGLTLQVAGESGAYVLSDVGTFLAFQDRVGLVALSKPAPALRNVYSVLRVDPARFDGRINAAAATRFAEFLLAPETQQQIAAYGRERFGRPLFTPLALEEVPGARAEASVASVAAVETPGGAAEAAPARAEAAFAPPARLGAELVAEITLRTLVVCLPALFVALLVGLPVGIALGRRRFRGHAALLSLVNAGMGAPPVVVGLFGALLLWRSGPLGFLDLMYTPWAMVLTQIAIALPFVVGITFAAVAALDPDWELQVRTLGIPSRWRLWLLLREIRLGLLAAVIAALGGILSEVGAVMMVGGNLEGETRVLTTAILMFTQMGEYEVATALAAVLVGLMLMLAGLLTGVQQGGRA